MLYFTEKGDWIHIGIWGENKKVVSKWGDSHVFEHPVNLPYDGVTMVSKPKPK